MPPGEAEERLRLVSETISEVIWMCTADLSEILYISPVYERVWGKSCESLRRNPASFLDNVHPDDVERVRDNALSSMRAGQPYQSEYRIIRADGTERWVWDRGFPIPEADGPPLRYVGAVQDVTDRKRAEAEAAQFAERFRLISRATTDGIWDWDVAANTAWWSDSYYALFAHDPGEKPSYAGWADRIHPDDQVRVLAAFTHALESGARSWTCEYRYAMPDGSTREVFDRAYVLRDAAGRPIRMLGAVMDLTERRSLEAQLRQAQKMEAFGQLAGGVAHDFNNILQAMSFQIALARSTHDGPHLLALQECTDRAASLTRQLLVFGRREAMQPRWLDLNALITDLARMLHRLLGEDVALRIELAPGTIPVRGDPGMLHQVLLNLALNARDAMPRGGTLTIATAVVGDEMTIEVRDTGCGMAPAVVQRIFEPFFTTKEVGRGTGLGLAVAFGIVEQHGGRIEVDTAVDRGTTMRTFLPLTAEPAPALEVERIAPSLTRGSETILVVEDDVVVRSLMCAVLQRQGYRVLSAERAASALRTWEDESGRIDLLLTDVVMPGEMDGKELATRLAERSPGLKVLFASGYSREDVNLQKPVTVDHLLSVVRARLDAP